MIGVVIRLVATDLDGTFWGPDLRPPPAHLAAARELMAAGITVLAATSRRPRVVQRQLNQAGLLLPAVLLDGGLGVDFVSGRRFHHACFDSVAALGILATFRAHGLDPCLYVDRPDIDIVVSEAPSTCAAHLAYLGSLAAVGDLEATAGTEDIYAFSLLGLSRDRLGPLADSLALAGESTTVLYPEVGYGQFGLTVNPAGVSKWTGIDAYCRQHGLKRDEVLAVGDGLNDIIMLREAGMAVGVRGGAKEAMAVCAHLIDPPQADGWTRIVELVDGG